MSLVIYFVRHGEVFNPEGIFYGRIPGYKLSSFGRSQATRAGEYLCGEEFKEVTEFHSSPMERTLETSSLIKEAMKNESIPSVQEHKNLLEVRSALEGKVVPSVLDFRLFYATEGENYDTFQQVGDRSLSFIKEMTSKHKTGTIIAVTHGDVIVTVRLWSKGIPITLDSRYEVDYPAHCSVTRLEWSERRDGLPDSTYFHDWKWKKDE